MLAASAATLWLAPWERSLAPTSAPRPPLRAAEVAGFGAPVEPVVMLPTGVLVDGRSVAVLPFVAGGGSDTLAAGLESDVVAALRSVPGLYVIAGASTAPYPAASELSTLQIGSELGAAGVVDATVTRAGARVGIVAHLRDARTGTTLWQSTLDEPIERLARARDTLANGIALALLDPAQPSTVSRGPVEASLAANAIEPTELSE